MDLLRYRRSNAPAGGYPDADLGRIATQQTVMRALMKKLLGGSLAELTELAKLFHESVTTDLSLQNLLRLGSSLLSGGLAAEDITFRTLDGGYQALWCEAFQCNLSYWVPTDPASPVSYAYDPAADSSVYIETARQLLWEAFSFDASGIEPSSNAGPQLTLSYTLSQTQPYESYVVEFAQDASYPTTLYHFCHPDSTGNTAGGGGRTPIDSEFLSLAADQAREFLTSVYGVDCSNGEELIYDTGDGKLTVQFYTAQGQVFHVRLYGLDPVGILFFTTSSETAQRFLEAKGAERLS